MRAGKLNKSWETNRASLISVIVVLAILISVRILNVGILDGAVIGAIIGVSLYYILNKVLPKSKNHKKGERDNEST